MLSRWHYAFFQPLERCFKIAFQGSLKLHSWNRVRARPLELSFPKIQRGKWKTRWCRWKISAKLILMYSVIAWQYAISPKSLFLHQTVQSLFILQQSSLCAVLTWPLFYISDINLVCSIVFCFGVVVPIVICKQHTENRPRVNFL